MTPSISDPILNDIATADPSVRMGSGAYVPETPKEEPKAEIATEPAKTEEAPKVEAKAEEVKTEPVKEEPKAESQPVIDMAKIFSEASNGKVNNAEELKKILEEYNTLSEKVKSSPELSEYTLKMDSWVKKGYEPELFHLVHDLPIDEMSADDQVKAYLKIQNPEWSEEDVNLYVKHTYNQLSEDEDGYNATTVKVGGLKLKQDSYQMAAELRKLQEATIFSNADEKEALRIEGERQTSWKSNLSNLANSLSKIPFPIDEKTSFDFVPTQAQIQNAVKAVENAVMNAPVSYDDNGIKSVKELIKTTLINQNINDIIKAVSKQVSSMVTEKKIQETHNPSAAVPTPAPVIEKSTEQTNYEKTEALFFS